MASRVNFPNPSCPPVCDPSAAPPELRGVERYEKRDRIASGVFGKVYRVRDKTGDGSRYYAMKINDGREDSFLAQDREEDFLTRLNRYDKTGADRRIVQFIDGFDRMKNLRSTILELLPENLRQARKEFTPTTEFTRQIAVQLFDSLNFLAEQGVVHADLKPDNILLADRNEPRIRLIDFGLSFFLAEGPDKNIQTLWYRAPEITLGITEYGAIDMWSAACVVYEFHNAEALFPVKGGPNENIELFRNMLRVLGPIPEEMREYPKIQPGIEGMNKYASEKGERDFFNVRRFIGHAVDLNGLDSLLDLVKSVLTYNPRTRLSPLQALEHPFLKG